MKIISSEDHRKHFAQGEIHAGELVTPFERPSGMEYIQSGSKQRNNNELLPLPNLGLKLPTLFVMKGGYALEAIGVNTASMLEGFKDA